MTDAKVSNIPLDTGYFKIKDEISLEISEKYRKAIGALLYIAVNTRPDILVSTSILSRKKQLYQKHVKKQLLEDFGEEVIEIKMFEDNQSCIKMLDSERINDRTKHIDTKYNYAKEMKKKNEIFFEYCPTNEMVADILTKPLEVNKIRKFREMMGLISSD
ncbi:hypothetical protein JTB14_018085 [Gonioctena quinquepunctata]|nr:hypothetical protein JTB14_018085 [Gonioctena quinquepunctata]